MPKKEIGKMLAKAQRLMRRNLQKNIKLSNEFDDGTIDKEPYKNALELYETVLALDPKNKKALEGKENAKIMIAPFYPQQTMMAPIPFEPIIDRKSGTSKMIWKTPWERKKSAMSSQKRNSVYTGDVIKRVMILLLTIVKICSKKQKSIARRIQLKKHGKSIVRK